MHAQIKHLSGEDVPKAWRPTWAVCWVVQLDAALNAGQGAGVQRGCCACSRQYCVQGARYSAAGGGGSTSCDTSARAFSKDG